MPILGRGTVQADSSCLSPTNPDAAPPSDFVPLTATDTELRCYGFPPRPTNPQVLQGWQTAMSHAKQWVPVGESGSYTTPPEPAATAVPPAGGLPNSNWAGKIVYASDQNDAGLYWDDVSSYWTVVQPHQNDAYGFYQWVGFGGSNGSTILNQDGTFTCDSGQPCNGAPRAYTFWYYNTTQGGGVKWQTSPAVSGGDSVYAEANFNGNTATSISFFLENITTGQYHTYADNNVQIDGSSADWIFENPYYATAQPGFNTALYYSTSVAGNDRNGSVSGSDDDFLNTLAYIYLNGTTNIYAYPYTTVNGSFHVCYKAFTC